MRLERDTYERVFRLESTWRNPFEACWRVPPFDRISASTARTDKCGREAAMNLSGEDSVRCGRATCISQSADLNVFTRLPLQVLRLYHDATIQSKNTVKVDKQEQCVLTTRKRPENAIPCRKVFKQKQ